MELSDADQIAEAVTIATDAALRGYASRRERSLVAAQVARLGTLAPPERAAVLADLCDRLSVCVGDNPPTSQNALVSGFLHWAARLLRHATRTPKGQTP